MQAFAFLQRLVEELKDMHAKDKTNKALIFTQYNDTIKYLGAKLQAAGFSYRTISGSMPMKKRADAIDAFQRDPPTTVHTPSRLP
jgi:SWI/SNF-related matrix-associated actin-dependent regulator of chromatin subfamily A3